jgi:hypothetical protein
MDVQLDPRPVGQLHFPALLNFAKSHLILALLFAYRNEFRGMTKGAVSDRTLTGALNGANEHERGMSLMFFVFILEAVASSFIR